MKTIPYLNFNGTCAEAFHFYAEVLRGDPPMIMPFAETPIAGEVPSEWHDRIMHAYLTAGEVVLMASDVPAGQEVTPQGISVSLHVDSAEEAERIFAAFAEGGTVTMPLDRTFWAERFGMVVDRFGTPWMVNFEGDAQEAS